MGNTKVTILIPSLNVGKYIGECLDSAINQTLREIEIICIDAGSTDGTLETIKKYVKKDARVKLIISDKKSYGYQMNLGIKQSKGEYINFLESDDCIELTMLEELYRKATENKLDIIKADYYELRTVNGTNQLKKIEVLNDKEKYGKILNPTENLWLFYVPMMNCLGLFDGDFIRKNNILHNETPGASHQDMGFWFQTFCLAKNIMYVRKPYYKYRQDNDASSMNNISNADKINCVFDEYEYIFEFLKKQENVRKWVAPVFYHRLFGSAYWRYTNYATWLKPYFLHIFSVNLKRYEEEKDFTLERFSKKERDIVSLIIKESLDYYLVESAKDKSLAEAKVKLKKILDRNLDLEKENLELKRKVTNSVKAPYVTVIIPVYNTEQYLEECLNSICGQSLKNIEIICINDGSTDRSLNILERYEKMDKRISVYTQVNSGQSIARNRGLKFATGKYIYFMDSDDVLDKNALKELYSLADKFQTDIIYFDGDTIFNDENLAKKYSHMKTTYVRKNDYSRLCSGIELFCEFRKNGEYRVAPCLQFHRRQYLVDNNVLYYPGIIYEDNIFSLACLLNAKKVTHVSKQYFKRRIRENSTVTATVKYRNFYGYFICYIQMSALALKYPLTVEQQQSVFFELEAIKRTTKRILSQLSKSELAKTSTLSSIEKVYYDNIFKENKNETTMVNEVVSVALQNVKTRNKINGCIQCYKEHGLIYTAKRIFQHLTGKAR